MLKLQSICRLGQDAIVNTVNGRTVINFSAAYSEKYKNSEGIEVSNTTWLSCAYWVEKATISAYLKKGLQIYLEGKPEARIYTNNQGNTVPQLNVRVSYVKLLSDKKEPEQQQEVVDDMPF
jgi:single-strand DNA-binding protein